MSLDHALLVSLLEKPSSGYELARRFDRSIGYFWHATHQQIYRVLSRMEEAGWLDAEVQHGETAPDRKEYSVTPTGRDELSRWLAEPTDPEGVRDILMVKLRGAAFGDVASLIPELEHHRAAHANRLTCYRVIETRDFAGARSTSPGGQSPGGLDRQRALQYMVLKSGIRFEQGWLEWCEEALGLLHSFKQ
ncbi:PadR family transcriptional regulator [Sulfuritalea sp.]|uniref:PadR family transcriptional regulator n=1 Tax=Sulfuritalea sp. TaxID=2480090 RepID=UPI00286DAF9E|nr:PadR family transcriptional regulator [Sulfuritalea sp.]